MAVGVCRDTPGDTAAACCDTAISDTLATRPEKGCDTAGARPRHDASGRHDTAQRKACAWLGRYVLTVCAQPGFVGCAPCAPNPVLTQDTVLSHCLGHCS